MVSSCMNSYSQTGVRRFCWSQGTYKLTYLSHSYIRFCHHMDARIHLVRDKWGWLHGRLSRVTHGWVSTMWVLHGKFSRIPGTSSHWKYLIPDWLAVRSSPTDSPSNPTDDLQGEPFFKSWLHMMFILVTILFCPQEWLGQVDWSIVVSLQLAG